MSETMLVMLDSLDLMIQRELLRNDPGINALVVSASQPDAPKVQLTQMGQPCKQGETQHTVYYGTDNSVWIRVVSFTPFGFAWAKVLGTAHVDRTHVDE